MGSNFFLTVRLWSMIVSFLMLAAGQQQRRLQIQSGRYDINHAVAAELFIESMNINVKEKGGNRFFSPRARCPYSFLLLAGDRCQRQRQIQPVHRDRGVAYDGGKHAMVVSWWWCLDVHCKK
jgi:hypothetical protein